MFYTIADDLTPGAIRPGHFIISGMDTKDKDREMCVHVNEDKKHLWTLTDCEFSRHWGLCVKRKCLWPEHLG